MFNLTNLAISKSTPKSGLRDRHFSRKTSNYYLRFDRNIKPQLSNPVAREKSRHLPFSNPPQRQELEAYLGWMIRDVVGEMRDFGYSVTLNVPESVMYLNTDFGKVHFYFDPEKSRINAVSFKG